MTPQEKFIFKFLLTALIIGLITGFIRQKWFRNTLSNRVEAEKLAKDIAVIASEGRDSISYINSLPIQVDQSINNKDNTIIPFKKVNINSSTKMELMTLPGIGPAIAERIINYRNNHGLFKKVDDIIKVKGIGKSTLQKIRDFITL